VIHISSHQWLGAADSLFTAVSPDESGDGEHSNYLFENIRFDTTGALLSVNWPQAKLRNFHFKDIRFGTEANKSFVRATVDGLEFENVRVGDRVARSPSDLALTVEGDARNLRFSDSPLAPMHP
jgi:hypothetical protein